MHELLFEFDFRCVPRPEVGNCEKTYQTLLNMQLFPCANRQELDCLVQINIYILIVHQEPNSVFVLAILKKIVRSNL